MSHEERMVRIAKIMEERQRLRDQQAQGPLQSQQETTTAPPKSEHNKNPQSVRLDSNVSVEGCATTEEEQVQGPYSKSNVTAVGSTSSTVLTSPTTTTKRYVLSVVDMSDEGPSQVQQGTSTIVEMPRRSPPQDDTAKMRDLTISAVLQNCELKEAEARCEFVASEGKDRASIFLDMIRIVVKGHGTFRVQAHNRDLIAVDLIKELYDSNRAHRDEQRQLVGMMSALGGLGGLLGQPAAKASGRRN